MVFCERQGGGARVSLLWQTMGDVSQVRVCELEAGYKTGGYFSMCGTELQPTL